MRLVFLASLREGGWRGVAETGRSKRQMGLRRCNTLAVFTYAGSPLYFPPPGGGRELPHLRTASPIKVVATYPREHRGTGKFSLPPGGEREEKATVWLFLEAKSQAQGAREAICDCDNERLCGRTGKGWRGVAETGRSKRQMGLRRCNAKAVFTHAGSPLSPTAPVRLAAARSRSGSDSPLDCHSRPSRRFATPLGKAKKSPPSPRIPEPWWLSYLP